MAGNAAARDGGIDGGGNSSGRPDGIDGGDGNSSGRPGTGSSARRPLIGIIGAMETEVGLLKEAMGGAAHSTIAGMDFATGSLGGVPVVVVRSGVGKVNAALCVQVLVDRFGVTGIVNTGAGGSLDAAIDIGDVVVSTDAMYHDVEATFFGYEAGQVPGMPVAYAADAALRRLAVEAVAKAAPDIRAFEGRVVSGDVFVDDHDVKVRIARRFGGLCCEMEGAAIAQASWVNGIPFVIVRAISDKADGSQGKSYQEFEDKAARDCSRIVRVMVEEGFGSGRTS